MTVFIIQHVPFEGPGTIEPWLEVQGLDFTIVKMWENSQLPLLENVSGVIVMGGPMGVHDEADYPWLVNEKAWLKQAIDLKKPILGICLGAQLLAQILGAKVCKALEKEIGWFPVQVLPNPNGFELMAVKERPSITEEPFKRKVFTPLHWHGETFDLPEGAIRLASTQACPNQAFIWQDHVVGLQFHLEATPSSLQKLVAHASDDITGGTYQQTPETILAYQPEELNAVLDKVLRFVLGDIVLAV